MVNAGEEMSEPMGGRQGANDVHMDMQKGIIGHRDVLNLRSVMAVELAALAMLTLMSPGSYVPLHAVPHETGADELFGGQDPRVG